MELGIVGLGKMGANMAGRLVAAGHRVVGFDLSSDAVAAAAQQDADGAASLEDRAAALAPPRAIWIMVPHGDPVPG